MTLNRCHWLLLALTMLWPGLQTGAQEVARIPIIDANPFTPGLGGGMRVNTSIYRGNDTDTDLVPLYLYEGKYLFAHGTSAGIHAFRNDLFEINLFARYRFLGLDPDDDAYYEGLEERDQSADAGIQGTWFTPFGEITAEYVTDVLDKSDGEEFDLTWRYTFDWGNWTIAPFVRGEWQDSDLTGYYYGVSEEEARPDRPAYRPGHAYNYGFGVNTSYHLTDAIFMYGNIGFQGYDRSIRNSPLVDEEFGTAAFIGAGYLFGETRKSSRVPVERDNEWSWRVNYGYSAEENIFPYLMMGMWEGSEDADTDIGGITVGKLVQSGPRVDYYARFALFRHFEKDFQDDFWNYTAYMMALGKGYLPWSEEPLFRWGFGFGVSYAEKVPAIEQIKQGNRDRNTSHLLNYLEFQVDFPLDRLTGVESFRNCFTGMTAVHRSGIFETADLLGSVSGGSDWVTFHVECLR